MCPTTLKSIIEAMILGHYRLLLLSMVEFLTKENDRWNRSNFSEVGLAFLSVGTTTYCAGLGESKRSVGLRL
jgi:hypothetical protein